MKSSLIFQAGLLVALAFPGVACQTTPGPETADMSLAPKPSGPKTYELKFTCARDADARCPASQPCPVLPLGSGGCGELPENLGHAAIRIDGERPVGCMAGLPYGNPFWDDSQVYCHCRSDLAMGPPTWSCPL